MNSFNQGLGDGKPSNPSSPQKLPPPLPPPLPRRIDPEILARFEASCSKRIVPEILAKFEAGCSKEEQRARWDQNEKAEEVYREQLRAAGAQTLPEVLPREAARITRRYNSRMEDVGGRIELEEWLRYVEQSKLLQPNTPPKGFRVPDTGEVFSNPVPVEPWRWRLTNPATGKEIFCRVQVGWAHIIGDPDPERVFKFENGEVLLDYRDFGTDGVEIVYQVARELGAVVWDPTFILDV